MRAYRQLEAGVRFLLRHQDRDGAWRDFRLRPGRSDAWTTAFIALRLLPCAQGSLRRPVQSALLMAARFLEAAREPHGGWAYNRRCPTDADSTACAILFLNGFSATVQPKDYAALARFQLADGGFATYRFGPPDHGWCIAHPEVTATALRALSGFLPPDHFRIGRGLAWLSDHLANGEAPSSYWWPSRSYFAIEIEHLRRIFPALPRCKELRSAHARDGFDLAQTLEDSALHCPPGPARELEARLLEMQDEDGGWPPSPVLRIPVPRNQTHDAPLAADDRRLMTTAAAVSALRTARSQRRAMQRESWPAAASWPPA